MAYIGKIPSPVPMDASDIPANSIDNTKIIDGAITIADIADDAVTEAKLANAINSAIAANTAKVTNATHTGDVTGATALTIATAAVDIAMLSATGTPGSTTFLRGDNSWQVVAVPSLDSPVITGTLAVAPSSTVTHTISNWSDDVTYTITPTNCTVGAVNTSGEFVITHTSGIPSYTIVATTASLGLDDSATVTKNIVLNLSAPTLSSPADAQINTNVVYTITSTDTADTKLILDLGSSNFTYGSVSHGSGSKVGNTVEVTGFTTNNPAITLQFTAAATYSVTAKAVDTVGSRGDSASSSADSITTTSFSATGGNNITTSGSYKYHTFTSSGTFAISGGPKAIDVLLVGGGGGTSGRIGGGGGGSGVLILNSYSAATGSYTIGVGNGGGNNYGSSSNNSTARGAVGGSSTIAFSGSDLGQVQGGGAGNGGNTPGASLDGSNPGGPGGNNSPSNRAGNTMNSAGYSVAGGISNNFYGANNADNATSSHLAGGGAGAGEDGGTDGQSSGGDGYQVSWATRYALTGAGDSSTGLYFGGGGAGCQYSTPANTHDGGLGGGGGASNNNGSSSSGGTGGLNNGTNGQSNTSGTNDFAGGAGGANTGGGGGGGAHGNSWGGDGGSGIVVVRYAV